TPAASYSSPLCVGETLQLNATNVSGATYNWTGKNNFSATTQNPTRSNMQFGDTGTYSVTATVNGCTSPAGSVVVNMNAVPFVVIFPTPGDSICVGEPASFTALANNHAGTPQYQWYVNGFPAGTNSPAFSSSSFNNGDIVRCDMTEYTKCNTAYTDASNDVEMKVLPWLAPSVSIIANPNRTLEIDEYVTFTATVVNGGNAPQFQWKRNGQDVQGATGPQWSANTLNDNDSISEEIVSSDRCPQPTDAQRHGIRVRVLTGICDVAANSGLTLYPNPNNGSFRVKGMVGTNNDLQIEIVNTIGQKIHEETMKPANNRIDTQIQLNGVSSGIYFIKVHTGLRVAIIQFHVE